MSCENLTGRQAQGQRKLLVEINAQFVKSALASYSENKDKSEYLGSKLLQKAIPEAIEYTGTASSATFTITGVDVTEKFPTGSWIVAYTKADFDAETNLTVYEDFQLLQVVSSAFTTDTVVTVDGTLDGTYDTAVPFVSKFAEVFGIDNIDFPFTSADITTNTNLSGAVETKIPGKITADISFTGLYMPNIPSQTTLERLMMNIGCPITAVVTRGVNVGEVFYEGSFVVKETNDGGNIDGTASQTLSGALQAKTGGKWKEFTAAEDYDTATTIKEY